MENKTIDMMLKDLKEPAESKEIRFKITEEDFRACGDGACGSGLRNKYRS